jgi:hypothetical protein
MLAPPHAESGSHCADAAAFAARLLTDASVPTVAQQTQVLELSRSHRMLRCQAQLIGRLHHRTLSQAHTAPTTDAAAFAAGLLTDASVPNGVHERPPS